MDLKYTQRNLGSFAGAGTAWLSLCVCRRVCTPLGSGDLSAPTERAGDSSLTGCVLWATFECQEWQLGS